jgi:GTP cyclohydrolase I
MIDKEKVMSAVRMFLEGIGENPDREGLLETPERVARMCIDMYGGLEEDPGEHLFKQFPAPGSELVIEKDIVFHSICEHHLLPFFGKVHIGYIPNGKVVGLSKLSRTVEIFAHRLQIQEQMTVQIADAIEHHLAPKGVIVMIEAEHTCMTMRGIKKPGVTAVTMATRGLFRDDFERQRLFLEATKSRYARELNDFSL